MNDPDVSNIQSQKGETFPSLLNTVTPLSKYLAMALFIIFPFLGGWIGYTYSPEKIIEVEKTVIEEVEKEINIFENISFSEDELTIIEAPELLLSDEFAYQTPFHIFSHKRHLISIAGPCRVSNELGKISETLDFLDKDQYTIVSRVTCIQVAHGTETLLLRNNNPSVGSMRVIHYPIYDCGLAPETCQPEGKPVSL